MQTEAALNQTDQPVQIVLAEDEPTVRVLLARQLKRAGFHVISCANGREALDAVTSTGAAIVIVDWLMPEMDGLQVCRALRELAVNDALGFVYVMVLSANSDKADVVEAFEAGADDFLSKPPHEAELLARLRAGLRLAELQRQLKARQIEVHRINAETAILNRRLQQLATTDDLTGLNNRRLLLERAADLFALSRRHDRPLTFLMLDLDNFKSINDTHGHDAGDQVLIAIASILREEARATDLCGRLGGEEFGVICPETPESGAVRLAERIRKSLEGHSVHHGSQELRVTTSIGISERRVDHACCDALITEADQALYAAKHAGRNQVMVFHPPGIAPIFHLQPAKSAAPSPPSPVANSLSKSEAAIRARSAS
jgi:diguanylate cyclase (GGDEF)-like protein